jgi:lipid A disaccharide synthetase
LKNILADSSVQQSVVNEDHMLSLIEQISSTVKSKEEQYHQLETKMRKLRKK